MYAENTIVNRCISDITNSSTLYHVSNSKTFDGFVLFVYIRMIRSRKLMIISISLKFHMNRVLFVVNSYLWHTASTVRTPYWLDMTAPMFVTSVISSFCGLRYNFFKKEVHTIKMSSIVITSKFP